MDTDKSAVPAQQQKLACSTINKNATVFSNKPEVVDFRERATADPSQVMYLMAYSHCQIWIRTRIRTPNPMAT